MLGNAAVYGLLFAALGLGVGVGVGRYVIPRKKDDTAHYQLPNGKTVDLDMASCAALLESLPAPWPDTIKAATSVEGLNLIASQLNSAGYPQQAACIRYYTNSADKTPVDSTPKSCDALIDAVAAALPPPANVAFSKTIRDALNSPSATKTMLHDLATSVRSMGGAVPTQLADCIDQQASKKAA